MDERELISAMKACIGTSAIAAEPCARVAARYADEREAGAVAAAVDAERARLEAEYAPLVASVRAFEQDEHPPWRIVQAMFDAIATLDADRVAASTTPTQSLISEREALNKAAEGPER